MSSFKMSFREKNQHAEYKKSEVNHLENMSKALNKAREYIIILLTHILYKITMSIVITLQKFTWPVTGVERTRKDAKSGLQFKQSAHVQNVFWRRKLMKSSVADPHDFITTHKFFKHPNYVLKNTVSLYCITKDEAIFVEVPEGINLFKVDSPETFFNKQFEHAHSIISMPLASCHKIAQDLGRPKLPILWISSTGHCGSTLLSRVFGQLPGMMVINEPDALTCLAYLNKSNKFVKGEYEQLLPSALRLLCKPDDRAGMILVKTRPCCTFQMQDVYRYFPHFYQMFVYRNSFKTIAASMSIYTREPIAIVAKYIIDSKILSTIFPCFRRDLYHNYCYILDRSDSSTSQKVSSCVGMFSLAWASNISQCLDLVDSGVPVIPILYEDMMKNPRKTCCVLFDILELRQEYISTALEGFRIDSNSSNGIGQSLAVSESRRIPHDQRVEADSILKIHGLPKLGERFEIPGLLDFDASKFSRMDSRDKFY